MPQMPQNQLQNNYQSRMTFETEIKYPNFASDLSKALSGLNYDARAEFKPSFVNVPEHVQL